MITEYKIHYTEPAREPAIDVVRGEVVRDNIVELHSHATFIPLAPSDWVTVDLATRTVTGVERLAPLWTYEVEFALPADLEPYGAAPKHVVDKIVALCDQWRRQGYVTQDSNFGAFVSSQTMRWLEDEVFPHRFVDHYEVIRTPSLRLNYDFAVQHPDLSGTRQGPWE